MKIVEKEVMVLRPVYIACDGTEFLSEEDCERHEISIIEKTIKAYNSEYEPTNVDDCIFVNLVTEEDVKNFKTVGDYYGFSTDGVDKPGLYMYAEYRRGDDWINLDDAVFHIRGGVTKDGKTC